MRAMFWPPGAELSIWTEYEMFCAFRRGEGEMNKLSKKLINPQTVHTVVLIQTKSIIGHTIQRQPIRAQSRPA